MKVDFGQVAKNYARYRNDVPAALLESLQQRGVIFKGKHIVDIGCGTGVLSRLLAEEDATVVGVEPAAELIQEAIAIDKEEGYTIDYQQRYSEDTGLASNAYQMVTVLRAWHWFDREQTLREIHRLLQDKGMLLIMDSGFLSYQPVVKDTLAFLKKFMPKGELKGAGSKATARQLIHSFPVEWFEEWRAEGFDLQETYKFYYHVKFTNAEWCGRIGSLSWLTHFEAHEREALLAQLYDYLQKEYGEVTHHIQHGCYITMLERMEN